MSTTQSIFRPDERRRFLMKPDLWPNGEVITDVKTVDGYALFNIANGIVEDSNWSYAIMPTKHADEYIYTAYRAEYDAYLDENLTPASSSALNYKDPGSGLMYYPIPDRAKYVIHSLRAHNKTNLSFTFFYRTEVPENWVSGERYKEYVTVTGSGSGRRITSKRMIPCAGASTITYQWGNSTSTVQAWRHHYTFYDASGNMISQTADDNAKTESVPEGATHFTFWGYYLWAEKVILMLNA